MALRRAGWTVVDKTHGNSYQPGWPDLFCFKPPDKVRWVEVKTPKGGLTPSQRARFACWTGAGLGVWVLDRVDDLRPLYGEANWLEWLTAPQLLHFKERHRVLCGNGPCHTDWRDWL